ncbi:MAG: methionine synthase [Candidatus Omnitrophota bacterium]
MRVIRGLATGVGSLPHREPGAALDLIFKYVPRAPFWPQLPKRHPAEGMVAQFIENLPCLKLKEGSVVFDPRDQERELESFYEKVISDDLEYFRISEEFALGLHGFFRRLNSVDPKNMDFIKLQVTGPFTFLAGIRDEAGLTLLHNPVFKQAMIKALSMKLRWQVSFFRKFGRPALAFIDEPYLGAFGSAYTPINREDVIRSLSELAEGVKDGNVLLGVHCCGNTDWSIFTDIPAIDLINFDAFSFQDKFTLYADNLKGFLQRGGIICWGIVPTQEFSGKEDARALAAKLRQGIESLVKKGVEERLLWEQMIISPACGLGTFDPQKAEQIFDLLAQTSDLIRKNP